MNKLPVGLQVYGLRDLLEDTPERFGEVMGQVRAMGYDGVEICPVCGWEDDKFQRNHPDFDGGANVMSLNQAREAYAAGRPVG